VLCRGKALARTPPGEMRQAAACQGDDGAASQHGIAWMLGTGDWFARVHSMHSSRERREKILEAF